MAVLNLSAPWQTYYKELSELFKEDNEVSIVYDTDEQVISIYVDNAVKAEAMAAALPPVKRFGSVELTITVIPSNRVNILRSSKGMGYPDLFKGNPIVIDVVVVDGIMSNPITYVIFKKEVVQYFNDDLGDVNGMCTTLYQDIAKRVFEEHEGVFFCTDTKTPSSYYTGCLGTISTSPTINF